MNKISQFSGLISSEIYQNELLQKNLLVQILASRRLLGDHCDLMEEAVADIPALEHKNTNIVSALNATGVVTTCAIAFSVMKNHYRFLIPCISGVIPIMYVNKLINLRKRQRYESTMEEFIKTLDEFEFSFKKIQTFFNDAMILEQHAKILERYNKDDQVAINMIFTIKRVIRALYCFLKYVETFYKIDQKLTCIYPEVDDVDNCEIMCMEKYNYADSKTYKDFFSLYAFVQSQLLLRLGFVFISNLNEAKFLLDKKIPDMISKVKFQTKLMPNFLDISKFSPKLKENVKKQIENELLKSLPKDLIQIRTTTIEFTLKTLGLAMQSQELESNIANLAECFKNPNQKDINNVMNVMEAIESQIAVCNDEQSRLLILIKKYLNKETDEENKADMNEKEETPAEPNVELKMVNEDDIPLQKDEFFYLDPAKEIEEDKLGKNIHYDCDDAEMEEWQVKKTKKNFKPVLEQLKERIVVIDEDMKEREKKSLKEKGIELPPEDKSTMKLSSNISKNDLQTDKNSVLSVCKKKRKYEENRDFLKQKGQINLLNAVASNPIPIPFINSHEEVFEDN